jgi:tetratricopeptide (TPR) repeat protein
MAYGYLQLAQDAKAKEILDRLMQIKKTHPPSDFVAAYATAAIPARYALERRKWAEAAALTLPPGSFWTQFPFAEAHIAYARAIGAARAGDKTAAHKSVERLDELARSVKDPRFKYFADQAQVQRQAAQGWIAWIEGNKEEAIKLLRQAADQEDTLGKHPVSPGSILPIRDLLAEVLLETGEPAEALTQYEASLKIYPARYNGIYGAARAARKAEKADLARRLPSRARARRSPLGDRGVSATARHVEPLTQSMVAPHRSRLLERSTSLEKR